VQRISLTSRVPKAACALLGACALLDACAAAPLAAQQAGAATRPNIVVLFADDLGYGDLSSYGSPTIRTPNLDRMAAEGVRFTSFYAAAPNCSPSRAGLLTGRYPVRSGINRVLDPKDTLGLPHAEVTLAEAVKARGYRTLAVGKWHLGHLPRFLPTAHGFDHYFGLPYSNDQDDPAQGYPPVPLLRDTQVVEQPAVQATLTGRYTDEAIRFARESKAQGQPFFVYLAYTMPHVPLHASPRFRGRSSGGLYGDVIEEIDWSAGRLLAALAELGIDRNTIVVFTSDNGPWYPLPSRVLRRGNAPSHTGSSGPLRGAKHSTYEGGVRVPAVVRWPGAIPPGRTVVAPATALDLYPTLVHAAGGDLPRDRPVDGHDLMPLLASTGVSSPTQGYLYYRNGVLEGVRDGKWKYRFARAAPGEGAAAAASTADWVPELFDLEADPGERFNVAGTEPGVAIRLRERMRRAGREVGDASPRSLGTAPSGSPR